MSIRKVSSTILGMALLTLSARASAQINEQAAREQASSAVRSELHSKLDFRPDRFLGVQRDEELEQSLALAVGGRAGLFIYKISPTGYEIGENTVVYHAWSDFDVVFIVGVNPADGSTYRIHGFGLDRSLAEFEKLMMALKVRVPNPDQAESFADFYRKVNPENYEAITPISTSLELKQAAERQCQSGLGSFDADQREFTAWWKRAKPLYAGVSFKQTATPLSSGYFVEWIVLSSAAKGNCGGAPLRARLEVNSDGRVGKVTFSPFKNQ
jgi:hypothetical protein